MSEHKPRTRGNGQGSVYKLPNGKYRAAITLGYTDEGKRVYKTKTGFKTKKEALEYLPTLRMDIELAKDIKFFKLYEEWSKIHFAPLSKSKQTAYRIAYNKCEPIHYRNIADLRLKDLQPLIDSCSGGYYPKHDIKVLCNLMFKYAVQNDYIVKSYSQFIKLPPLEKSKREGFTSAEIKLLWKDHKIENDFTGYVLLLIYTGMRLGELQKLKKEDIDLQNNVIVGGIKTDAGKDRQIVIASRIKPIITEFYFRAEKKLLEIPEKVFYEKYYEVLERAKVRKLTPHCCRHTFATLMAESGAQPAVIKDIAGHESYETTLQYTHISLNEKLKAVNKI